MSDLALYRRSDGYFDLDFDKSRGDLLTSDTIENAVIISIGTHARERKLGRNANLKPCVGGWWGDALDDKGVLGGYLYEAFPGKLTASTAKSVENLVKESLQWMIDDGVAKSVDCSSNIINEDKVLTLSVVVTRPDGKKEDPFLYELKWKATDGI